MSLSEYVAEQIRTLRRRHGGRDGISQEALGKGVGVATNTVSRWETGTYKPSLDDLEKIARFFKVSILEFFPPEQEDGVAAGEPITRLLSAAKELPASDIDELRQYAEFRRARAVYQPQDQPRQAGRKRKE